MRVHLTYLDGWRGCAILALLVGHFIGVPHFDVGRFGVELFFVLSGRLMAHILFIEAMPLRTFYLRRVARIFPAMIAFIAGLWLLSPWTPFVVIDFASAISALTFTLNYTLGTGAPRAIQHIWSLCIEEHSYLTLSIIAFWSRDRDTAIKVLLAISVAVVASGAIQTWMLGHSFYEVYWRTDTHMSSITMASAAYLYFRSAHVPAFVPLASGIAGVMLHAYVVPDPIKYSAGTALLAIAAATIDSAPQLSLRLLSLRWLTVTGTLAYSIYLWQQPFTLLAIRPRVGLIIAIVLGALSFQFIESPARKWINANGPLLLSRFRLKGA